MISGFCPTDNGEASEVYFAHFWYDSWTNFRKCGLDLFTTEADWRDKVAAYLASPEYKALPLEESLELLIDISDMEALGGDSLSLQANVIQSSVAQHGRTSNPPGDEGGLSSPLCLSQAWIYITIIIMRYCSERAVEEDVSYLIHRSACLTDQTYYGKLLCVPYDLILGLAQRRRNVIPECNYAWLLMQQCNSRRPACPVLDYLLQLAC